MPTWIKPEQRTTWDQEDFKLEAEPLIAQGIERAKQSFQQAADPVQQALTSFAVPSLESLTSGWTTKPTPENPEPSTRNPPRSEFSVPNLGALTAGWLPRQEPEVSGSQVLGSGSSGVGSPRTQNPASANRSSDFNTYVRESSAQRGLDPDQVLKVVGKEGPTGWGSVGTFNTGTSYGPLQLHYAGGSQPTAGMGDDFTKATGIDLRKVDPNTPEGVAAHQRAVDFALDRLSTTGDYREWYGADPALGSRFTKVNRVTPTAPAAPAAPASAASPAGAPAWGTYTAETLTPNQFNEGKAQGLTADEAMAVCGPAAAVAFARANGRNPTLREAKELGSQLGVWDVGNGMHGPATQVTLLEKMGVPSRLQQGADEGAIAREIQAGRPVILDLPLHYMTATAYDPQTRQFEFGQSAGVLKASGGRTRYRLDELAGLGMGAPRSTIMMGASR